YRWLDTLCTAGLVRLTDRYALTPAGAAALAAGRAPWPTAERRHFLFLVGPGGAAHFLPWTGVTTRPLPGIAADVRWLGECAVRRAAGERRIGVPAHGAGGA